MEHTRRSGAGWRSARLLVSALAVGAIGATVVTGAVAARRGGQRDLDRSAQTAADTASVALDQYFREARSNILVAARNPALLAAHGHPPAVPVTPTAAPSPGPGTTKAGRVATTTTVAPAVVNPYGYDDVVNALRVFHDLYPDTVGEACLMDPDGVEIASMVGSVVTPPVGLSHDERAAPFFAPTLALAPGEVYQARPYVSPDTEGWVISHSTLVTDRAGRPVAILHFEASLESFRRLINAYTGTLAAEIVDARTGDVIVDTRTPMHPGDPLGRPAATKSPFLGGARGQGRFAGADVAFHRLDTRSHPDDDWVIVVPVPAASSSLVDAVNPTTLALALAGLALLVVIALLTRSDRLRKVATTDALTGMPNRAAFNQEMKRALETAKGKRTQFAVLLLDLNRFKSVNDQLGHELGDELLRLVGPRLRHALRPGDFVARLGSDEFAVVLEDVRSAYSAESLARRVAAAVEQPYTVGGIAFTIEVSVGVAIGPSGTASADDLVHRADAARSAAKRRQLGVSMYEDGLQTDAQDGLAFVSDLRRGIEAGELVVHYQPKIDLRTGQAKSVEALVRWQHPDRGFIPPGEFLPLAEQTRLIGPLTDYVLRSSLAQCRAWLDAGWHLPVAVNISANVLHDATFVENVRYALAVAGLAPEMLILEVTETAMMSEPDAARGQLSTLFGDGVEISIDDFGTGYSSLAYLQTLDIDELKIDRSFVSAATSSSSGLVVVRTIVELGHSLGLRVVAEGIEDAATEAALSGVGCDVGQGYWWSKPVDPVTMIELLARRITEMDAAAASTPAAVDAAATVR